MSHLLPDVNYKACIVELIELSEFCLAVRLLPRLLYQKGRHHPVCKSMPSLALSIAEDDTGSQTSSIRLSCGENRSFPLRAALSALPPTPDDFLNELPSPFGPYSGGSYDVMTIQTITGNILVVSMLV